MEILSVFQIWNLLVMLFILAALVVEAIMLSLIETECLVLSIFSL